jgi:hypothetical protein
MILSLLNVSFTVLCFEFQKYNLQGFLFSWDDIMKSRTLENWLVLESHMGHIWGMQRVELNSHPSFQVEAPAQTKQNKSIVMTHGGETDLQSTISYQRCIFTTVKSPFRNVFHEHKIIHM